MLILACMLEKRSDPRATRALVLAAALALAAVAVACQPSYNCTLLRVGPQLWLHYSAPVQIPYTVELEFDGWRVSALCGGPSADDGLPGPALEYEETGPSGSDGGARAPFSLRCDERALVLSNATPAALSVTLDGSGTATVFPDYRQYDVNGPGCGGSVVGEVGLGFELNPCRAAKRPLDACVTGAAEAGGADVDCRLGPVCGSDGRLYGDLCDLHGAAGEGTCPAADPIGCCGVDAQSATPVSIEPE